MVRPPSFELEIVRGRQRSSSYRFEERFLFGWQIHGRGECRAARIEPSLGPDVEAATQDHHTENLPGAPDAFPFVEAAIQHDVLAKVALGPETLAVADRIAATDEKRTDDVLALAPNHPVTESQPHLLLRLGTYWNFLRPEASPFAARKPRVGFIRSGRVGGG